MTDLSVWSNEEYLEKKVRCLVEPLITSLLIEKPIEPILFMIEWLQNYSGTGVNSSVNTERAELQFLRKEMVKYNKSYKDETNAQTDDESEEEDEDLDKFEAELKMRKEQQAKKGQRASVSAEAYGSFNKKKEYVPRVISKSKDQIDRISLILENSFLFSTLCEKEKNTVLLAFEERKLVCGECVINQGDQGDTLYLIEKGYYECYKKFNKTDPPKMVRKYEQGEFFGELALLYNTPRAASVFAKSEDCVVWALDRETFNNIVKEASIKKREKYMSFLSNVEIFKTLNDCEIGLIADAIREENVPRDEVIIKQGETGDKFFILEEGKAVALKTFNNDIAEEVYNYSEGDFFGELALIKDEPRAATVKTVTDCKFLSLDRMSFKRLLGPLLNLLKKNSELYQKFSKQLLSSA